MTGPRRRATAVVAALLTLGLSGCGQESEEAYCETVREERQVLAGLAGDAGEPGADVLGQTLESLQAMREDAPAELEDEYATVVNAWEALSDAVADAGIDPDEYDREETLRGLDRSAARRIRQTAIALGSQRVSDASAGIEDHALQVCEVDFSE